MLTHRIAHVIATERARPDEILAVTFTNKAAREMRERVAALLGGDVGGMWLGTFHSIGVRVLRRDGAAIGIPREFSIYDEGDRVAAVRRAMQAAGVDDKRFPPAQVAHQISAAKNELQNAEQYAATAGAYYGTRIAEAFRAYERELQAAGALDFDDLLVRVVELFEDVPEVAAKYQHRFRHIFVDEYQDTNRAQYRLVQLLCAVHDNVTVVGDDDQCLAAGTAVTMADGSLRPIEDVRPGDRVLSSYGSGDFRPASVVRIARRRAAEGVRITTRSGRAVVSTPEHTHFAGYGLGFDTESSARRLLADAGLSIEHPHYRPRSRNSSRRHVVVTLCGDRRGATPMHRVAISGNDEAGRAALASLGLSVRASKVGATGVAGWRYETAASSFEQITETVRRIQGVLDAEVVLTARLGRNSSEALGANSLPFLPAAAVQPGMVMFSEDGGHDVVEVVERVRLDVPVHDIDVEWTHNFVANGLVTHNSIYGWRGADVRNILSFQHDHPNTLVVTLEQNYRSTQVILDAAHAVIRHNSERAAKQLWTERMGGAKVRIVSVYDEQEEAVAITSEIEGLVRAEEFSYSDCAVLYRTNAQSRALEDVLLRRGIPYRLVGGPRFYERREIKDVLAYLRLIANPRDAVSFARIVNVPRRKIGDRTVQELEQLARRHRISPFEAVRHLDEVESLGAAAITALEGFRKLVDGLRADASQLPLPELLERVLVESGYKLMLQDGTPEGEERWNNVTELVGLSGEYADEPPPQGLQSFLENVALVSDVDSLDAGGTGVTLITLHQVKGLEFPVVFIAGMEEGLMPHLRAMEEGDAGLAEERRLAYVGITRAQKRLYLLHAFRRHLYGTPQLAEASRFLRDLPAELIEIPQRPGGPPPGDPRSPGAVHRAIHAHAVRPNPVEVAPQLYVQGMRVRHRKYGDGTILKSIMTRSGEEVTIKFDEAGLKIFAVADAGAALSPLR